MDTAAAWYRPTGPAYSAKPALCAYQYGMLFGMVTEQIAIRLPEELLDRVDELVEEGVYESRAAAVRAGLEILAELARRRALDDAIVRGYERLPPTPAERASALASLREAITEEPW
jgi:Arc/MetJ-type ribon-helix-helix transcriptional regulator